MFRSLFNTYAVKLYKGFPIGIIELSFASFLATLKAVQHIVVSVGPYPLIMLIFGFNL